MASNMRGIEIFVAIESFRSIKTKYSKLRSEGNDSSAFLYKEHTRADYSREPLIFCGAEFNTR